MKKFLVSFVFILAACGESVTIVNVGENQENQNTVSNQNAGNNQTSIEGDEHGLTDMFRAEVEEFDMYSAFSCDCYYQDMGYASAEVCRDDFMYGSDGVNAVIACIANTANSFEPDPPSTVATYISCKDDGLAALHACYAHLDDADICSSSNVADFEACELNANDSIDACSGLLNEEGQNWMSDFNLEVAENECY